MISNFLVLVFPVQLEPLRQENERILRENNELHQQMIKVKEESKQMEN